MPHPGFISPVLPLHARRQPFSCGREAVVRDCRSTRRQAAPTMNTPNDLLIIGAGHLGRRIAQSWRQKHPVAEIVGETRTEANHKALSALSITPILSGTPTPPFPNVVFCAPPSAFPDYPIAVAAAAQRVAPNGRFVFTSSTSVYGDASFIDERTPTQATGRAERMFLAERAVLSKPEGVVVRLAGLYTIGRGPHTFWFSRGEVTGAEDSTVNMIHYDDAAEAVVCALLIDQVTERIFLAAGSKEISRKEIMQAALQHPLYEDQKMPRFSNDSPPRGRRHDASWSRSMLGWKPKFETFAEFIDHDASSLTGKIPSQS